MKLPSVCLLVGVLVALGACSKSQPKQLAKIDGEVNGIAADASFVYVTVIQLGKPRIDRIPRAGGAAETKFTPGGIAYGLALDHDHVYWGELDEANPNAGSGTVQVTPEDISKANGDVAKAVSAGMTLHGMIMDTGKPLAQLAGTPTEIVVDDHAIYAISFGEFKNGTLETKDAGSVVSIAKAGGTSTLLASKLTKPRGLSVSGGTVFWTDESGGWKVVTSGGKPERADARATSPLIAIDGDQKFRAETKTGYTTVTVEPR